MFCNMVNHFNRIRCRRRQFKPSSNRVKVEDTGRPLEKLRVYKA